jgi:coenzyme F420-0:L-glutamate ligase / coenzyme F420-1:gamma-L-glutamate ligase
MDLQNFLRSRRSIRHFKSTDISDSLITKIITTAAFAPSAHNRQPWRFVLITKAAAKSHLADSMAIDFRRDLEHDNLSEEEIQGRIKRSRDRITSSPVIILLCMDMSEMDNYPDARRSEAEKIMAIQSTANAGMQLLLAAHAEGLGAVWTCSPLFAPETLRLAFDLPNTWEPQGMFCIGYPAENPEPRIRKSLDEIMRVA